MDTSGIGERIKKVRGQQSLTSFVTKLRDLGVAVSAATLMRYEKGKTAPPIDVVIAVAAVGGKSLSWMAAGEPLKLQDRLAEEPELYGKRARLVREVKQLARDADEDVIDALIKNVEVFKKVPKS